MIVHHTHPAPPVISLAGGGGKTTLVYRLIQESCSRYAQGIRIATTTTMMYDPDVINSQNAHPFDQLLSYEQWLSSLPDPGALFLYDRKDRVHSKVFGISQAQVDSLASDPRVSCIVCESDGAHRLPVKAPNAQEPLHPSRATAIVGMIGLSSYGKPLDEQTVHRMAQFRLIVGEGASIIDAGTYRDLICHPLGLFKHAPEGAERIIFLNQADLLDEQARLELFSQLCESALPADRLIIGSLRPITCIYHTTTLPTGDHL
ncbi:MAG: putative selenium-dependent hydroxylase accessory protein YqeC [Spirochaetia bacterium]|nr:putative selenium-dependent hydroxylase accessory protein YqeC [Spirochaetia bacterium]